MWFLALYISTRLFWKARETLVKQPADPLTLMVSSSGLMVFLNTFVHNGSRLSTARSNIKFVIHSRFSHCEDVIMSWMASQITSLTIVYSTVYPGADQKKHQSSVSLAFVRGIHQGPVNSPHKRPVMRKMFPFDDIIMPPDNMSLLPYNVS